ncbi:MAG: DUF3737 family protein [Solobacterium sp.]|nr:DUF3737 family protein [Solobacterium sp.]
MKEYRNEIFDEERALYGSRGITVDNCRFDGPADGESALKECEDVKVSSSYFNLRYPFWHDKGLSVTDSQMTENCRAALWYSADIRISGSQLHGIKALRECENVAVRDCDIVSGEFGWSVRGITMENSSAAGEYFMMRSEKLRFDNVKLNGKYSFQYITDSEFANCVFDTKDAFWHARNVVVRDSVIKGEYLAWYSENITFINCTIIGTQPLCYCRGLKLVNCTMIDTDLAFERSEVDAVLNAPVISIKNPRKGRISAPGVGKVIMDDPMAEGKVIIG